MVAISIDFNVLTDNYMLRFHNISISCLVTSSLQELTSPESRILVVRLINLKTVIIEEVSYDEHSVCILRFGWGEHSIKPQLDLLINPLEERFLRWFGDQSVDVSKRIFFWADSVVRRDDDVWIRWYLLDLKSWFPPLSWFLHCICLPNLVQ